MYDFITFNITISLPFMATDLEQREILITSSMFFLIIFNRPASVGGILPFPVQVRRVHLFEDLMAPYDSSEHNPEGKCTCCSCFRLLSLLQCFLHSYMFEVWFKVWISKIFEELDVFGHVLYTKSFASHTIMHNSSV
jgi:hypothetical protein